MDIVLFLSGAVIFFLIGISFRSKDDPAGFLARLTKEHRNSSIHHFPDDGSICIVDHGGKCLILGKSLPEAKIAKIEGRWLFQSIRAIEIRAGRVPVVSISREQIAGGAADSATYGRIMELLQKHIDKTKDIPQVSLVIWTDDVLHQFNTVLFHVRNEEGSDEDNEARLHHAAKKIGYFSSLIAAGMVEALPSEAAVPLKSVAGKYSGERINVKPPENLPGELIQDDEVAQVEMDETDGSDMDPHEETPASPAPIEPLMIGTDIRVLWDLVQLGALSDDEYRVAKEKILGER